MRGSGFEAHSLFVELRAAHFRVSGYSTGVWAEASEGLYESGVWGLGSRVERAWCSTFMVQVFEAHTGLSPFGYSWHVLGAFSLRSWLGNTGSEILR